MMFVFGYIGQSRSPPGWPLELIHATETVLIMVAAVCLGLALVLRYTAKGSIYDIIRAIVAAAGGISAGIALVMPFELAPFFFKIGGEIMMATMVLILAYPVAAALFFVLLHYIMKPAQAKPPALPQG